MLLLQYICLLFSRAAATSGVQQQSMQRKGLTENRTVPMTINFCLSSLQQHQVNE